jgi:LytS/YehU family sensor histidine kinase
MLVQTLVENGIKHGVAAQPEGGMIRVDARLKYDALQLRVINTGQFCDEDDTGGLGLQNVRERLHLLFGDDATLLLRMDGPNTVVAEAWLPQHALSADTSSDRVSPVPEPS